MAAFFPSRYKSIFFSILQHQNVHTWQHHALLSGAFGVSAKLPKCAHPAGIKVAPLQNLFWSIRAICEFCEEFY